MKKFATEFKEFISKGSVIDMAVAVVIGGAFGKIVSSFVNDIIMPLIGLLFGGVNISELKWVFTPAVLDEAGEVVTPEAALTYGAFIQTIIDFILVALCIFLFIKAINKMKKKEEEAPAEPTTKKCPFCQSEIDIKATRCPHCTSEIKE